MDTTRLKHQSRDVGNDGQFIAFYSRMKCKTNWENKIDEPRLCLLLVSGKYLIFYRGSSNKEIWSIDLKIDLNITDCILIKLAYLLFPLFLYIDP